MILIVSVKLDDSNSDSSPEMLIFPAKMRKLVLDSDLKYISTKCHLYIEAQISICKCVQARTL